MRLEFMLWICMGCVRSLILLNLLISPDDDHLSGSAVAASVEGLRPLLLETQALVSPAIYGTPQRSATGFDLRRLSMLLAVLEKRCGLPFGQNDVFLNIAGGIKVTDPSIDLAVVSALDFFSSGYSHQQKNMLCRRSRTFR
jgi:predicted ATP-dependent serine protease